MRPSDWILKIPCASDQPRGSSNKDKGQTEMAHRRLRRGDPARSPKSPQPTRNRGRARLGKGRLDRAIADLNEAIRLALEDVRCYAGRGMVWERKGELREASLDLDEAVRLDPKDAEVLSWRAGLWAMKDEPDKAFADCDGAIRLNPHLAEAYACRGAVLAEKQETDKAIADLDRAIRLKSPSRRSLRDPQYSLVGER